jgi:hypothetical protein
MRAASIDDARIEMSLAPSKRQLIGPYDGIE